MAERTRIINRLRWHLHELDPTWDPPVRSFDWNKTINQLTQRLADRQGTIARLAVQVEGRVRPLQRHRAPTSLVIRSSPPSPQRSRQPAAELRDPPDSSNQAHWHPEARAYLERRRASGDTPKEALRALKRRLSDVVDRALLADAAQADSTEQTENIPTAA